ncbi:hypothetical protein QOT17_25631 [Balamuthia mandrillaris]
MSGSRCSRKGEQSKVRRRGHHRNFLLQRIDSVLSIKVVFAFLKPRVVWTKDFHTGRVNEEGNVSVLGERFILVHQRDWSATIALPPSVLKHLQKDGPDPVYRSFHGGLFCLFALFVRCGKRA